MRNAEVVPATSFAWRMMKRESTAQKPLSGSARCSSQRFGSRRTRSSGFPTSERTAGRNVTAASTETAGMISPPTPKPRMKGSGMNKSSASPSATAVPLNTTARPAVSIVVTIASSRGDPRRSSSR